MGRTQDDAPHPGACQRCRLRRDSAAGLGKAAQTSAHLGGSWGFFEFENRANVLPPGVESTKSQRNDIVSYDIADTRCARRVGDLVRHSIYVLLMICSAMLLNTLTNIAVSSATTVMPCDNLRMDVVAIVTKYLPNILCRLANPAELLATSR
jgi:hypothetical protein